MRMCSPFVFKRNEDQPRRVSHRCVFVTDVQRFHRVLVPLPASRLQSRAHRCLRLVLRVNLAREQRDQTCHDLNGQWQQARHGQLVLMRRGDGCVSLASLLSVNCSVNTPLDMRVGELDVADVCLVARAISITEQEKKTVVSDKISSRQPQGRRYHKQTSALHQHGTSRDPSANTHTRARSNDLIMHSRNE